MTSLRSHPVHHQRLTADRALLQRDLAPLIVPYPDRLIDLRHEDLAIPDLARTRGRRNRLDRPLRQLVSHHDLQLHLRQQIDRILTTPVELRMPLLPSMAPGLEDRNPFDP